MILLYIYIIYVDVYTQNFHFDFQHIRVWVFTSGIVKHGQADSRAFMIVRESAEMLFETSYTFKVQGQKEDAGAWSYLSTFKFLAWGKDFTCPMGNELLQLLYSSIAVTFKSPWLHASIESIDLYVQGRRQQKMTSQPIPFPCSTVSSYVCHSV